MHDKKLLKFFYLLLSTESIVQISMSLVRTNREQKMCFCGEERGTDYFLRAEKRVQRIMRICA